LVEFILGNNLGRLFAILDAVEKDEEQLGCCEKKHGEERGKLNLSQVSLFTTCSIYKETAG